MKYGCHPLMYRKSYSLSGVTIRKKRALAQNSWFIDLKFNRNCCNRCESYCYLTHTKLVSSWSFPKPRCICSVPNIAIFTCRHLELQSPTPTPAGQNFLPTSVLESCQPSWKLLLGMDLPLGRQGHCFHTHTSICWMPRSCSWNKKTVPGHSYSFRSFPKAFGDGEGEWTWLKEVKICSWCEVNETVFLLGWQQKRVY